MDMDYGIYFVKSSFLGTRKIRTKKLNLLRVVMFVAYEILKLGGSKDFIVYIADNHKKECME